MCNFGFSTVPKTEPIGDTVRYVKEGSRVTLHCVISGAIDPPLYVIWYHGQQQIFPDNPRHWKTEVSHQDVHTNKLAKSNDENEALALSQQSMFDSRKTVSIFISIVFFIIRRRFHFKLNKTLFQAKQLNFTLYVILFIKMCVFFCLFSGRHTVYSGD